MMALKQQPILPKAAWVDQCCGRLITLDRTLSAAQCHALASRMWDRGEAQVMAPVEAAEHLHDERVHSGYRDDLR